MSKSWVRTGGAKARPPWAAGRAPTVQQRREGRGRCVRRVDGRCAEDGGEGARRLARGARGSRRRRRRAWDCPSVAEGPSLSATEREWGKEQKICAEGPSGRA